MKTVKDVSEITGISIRTLRYYDEIGLLKPAKLTYSSDEKFAEIIDRQYGAGCAEYIARAIKFYYGI